MKIAYYANFRGWVNSDETEQHIVHSLKKLGHEVIEIMQGDPIDVSADFLLCHKPDLDLIKDVKMPKVIWYFDKVWHKRIEWVRRALEVVDYFFLTDETWAMENPNPKFHVLRQGVGDDKPKGIKRAFQGKVVFVGNIYGDGRVEMAKFLSDTYGEDFKNYGSLFNQGLRDLCVSCPIFVAPQHPSDNHYWSSRVYIIMGSGGFMIHPYCSELTKEYEDGKEIVYYRNNEELKEKIDYYLSHPEERERIRLAGYDKTLKNYTYTDRIRRLCSTIRI